MLVHPSLVISPIRVELVQQRHIFSTIIHTGDTAEYMLSPAVIKHVTGDILGILFYFINHFKGIIVNAFSLSIFKLITANT